MDYHSVTDNGDRNIVLLTVSGIIEAFIELYPSNNILQRYIKLKHQTLSNGDKPLL